MRVLTDKKRDEITDAAGRIFLAHGFGVATIAMIAAEAQASKATLYRYFQSKEEIFAAYVERAGAHHAQLLAERFPLEPTAEASLRALGRRYLALLLSPPIVAVNRLVIGEAERFPQLTEIYFENGPRKVIDFLERALADMVAKGWIDAADTRRAAWHFKAQCELRLYERSLWGFRDAPGPEAIEAHLQSAIPLFLQVLKAMAAMSAPAPTGPSA
ncbi:TetR/AcrR family transcriptional regulator [Phaeovulum sp. W22_SRMD_FR3]|uniref:TetR/AcrR family transcriptional regulator n=1 Tax=Phaeovulum sp. W22_SRMD_FR3 TaxID=3240274 RepID=UPI003F99B478